VKEGPFTLILAIQSIHVAIFQSSRLYDSDPTTTLCRTSLTTGNACTAPWCGHSTEVRGYTSPLQNSSCLILSLHPLLTPAAIANTSHIRAYLGTRRWNCSRRDQGGRPGGRHPRCLYIGQRSAPLHMCPCA
jgi:hypothetical protein